MFLNPLKALKKRLDAHELRGFDPNRRIWRRKHIDIWKSNDGCVVRINALEGISNALNSVDDPRYGWIALGPEPDQVVYERNRRTGKTKTARFKTAEEAMEQADRIFPFSPKD